MIVWKESYSTGVTQLDNQHKALFQFTNDLEKSLEEGQISEETVNTALNYLKQYIQIHFNREETCMHQHACPIAGKNQEAHKKFIQKYTEMEAHVRLDPSNAEHIMGLRDFLESWLVEHICKIDTQLKPCVPSQAH